MAITIYLLLFFVCSFGWFVGIQTYDKSWEQITFSDIVISCCAGLASVIGVFIGIYFESKILGVIIFVAWDLVYVYTEHFKNIEIEKKRLENERLKAEQAREKARLEKLKPCIHGVQSAFYNYLLCPHCVQERVAQPSVAITPTQGSFDNPATNVPEFDICKKLIKLVNIHFLRGIKERDFEVFTARLFEVQGYKSTITQYSNDGGIDVILKKDNGIVLVQCKRNSDSTTVGRPVFQQLYGNMYDYQEQNPQKVVNCKVVTTGFITNQARSWIANKPKIEAIECNQLIKILKENILVNNEKFNNYLIDLLKKHKINIYEND